MANDKDDKTPSTWKAPSKDPVKASKDFVKSVKKETTTVTNSEGSSSAVIGSGKVSFKEDKKPETITKAEVERMSNRMRNEPKDKEVNLNDVVSGVKARTAGLQEEKGKRSQQKRSIIVDLRRNDPKGKRTCGRCAQRTPLGNMDSEKNLCEVCAS